jgi:hypothetical protein
MNVHDRVNYMEAMRALNQAVEAARQVRNEYALKETNIEFETAQAMVNALESAYADLALSRVYARSL